jgi:hypothetical protein
MPARHWIWRQHQGCKICNRMTIRAAAMTAPVLHSGGIALTMLPEDLLGQPLMMRLWMAPRSRILFTQRPT